MDTIFAVDDGSEPIGFTACGAESRDYNVSEIVLFERVLTNYGGYYSSQASSFMCPIDGVYVFTLAINVVETNIGVCINRNGVELTTTWVDGAPHNHATNAVVTECLTGDVIWPRIKFISGDNNIYSEINCFTSFSGVLIKHL